MTHTYAVLEVSPAAFGEVRLLLERAGYQQAFHRETSREVIDMHGIALAPVPEAAAPVEHGGFGVFKSDDMGSVIGTARLQADGQEIRVVLLRRFHDQAICCVPEDCLEKIVGAGRA